MKIDAADAQGILRFLGNMPGGNCTATRAAVQRLLLDTGGQMLSSGKLYEIKAKALGAGVYRVTLAPWKGQGAANANKR